jgi:hypothetical protein
MLPRIGSARDPWFETPLAIAVAIALALRALLTMKIARIAIEGLLR